MNLLIVWTVVNLSFFFLALFILVFLAIRIVYTRLGLKMFHFLVCWPGFEKKKITWFVYVSTYQGLACRAFKQSFFFLFIFFSGECCCVLVYTRYKEYWKKPPRNFLFFKKIGTWSPDVFFFPIIRKGINAVLTLFSESFFFAIDFRLVRASYWKY